MSEDVDRAAGWRPDPTGRSTERYWDGVEWSEHVRTDDIPGTDPYHPVEGTAVSAGSNAPPVWAKLSRTEQLASAARAALIAKSIAEAAASDVGLLTKKGKVSKFGLAKAAVRPVKTSKKVAGSVTSAVINNFAQGSDAAAPGSPSSEH